MIRNDDIGVADLLLDVRNPRHERQSTQREAIAALLADAPQKMLKLAAEIAKNGLSPIDEFMVMPASEGSTSSYVVLEGNRRTACLKILNNPELVGDHQTKKQWATLAKTVMSLPTEVRCAIVDSREEAKPWLELRHSGEANGAGVVPWSAESRARFSSGRSGHREWGLRVIDNLRAVFPHNTDLQRDLETVRKERLTTLGRLFEDTYVRERLAYRKEGSGLAWHYDATQIEAVLGRIMADIADPKGTSVSDLKSKPQRRKYIDDLGGLLPAADAYRSDAAPLQPVGGPVRGRKKPPKPSPAPTPPTPPTPPAAPVPLFDGLTLTNLGSKTTQVLAELQKLPLEAFPNGAAVLIRVLMELAVYQAYSTKHAGKDPADLKAGVKWCLKAVDPTDKDARFTGVRAGLADGTSMLAIRTIQAYLHNVHSHPSPTEARALASNYQPFLKALDGLV